jgi:N utilization substance protein B
MALQVLFQMDFGTAATSEEAIGLYAMHFDTETEVREYATRLIHGVWENRSDLDHLIRANSKRWNVDRMALVDRNILRIGTFELIHLGQEIPPSVVIDEAIEIGKRFGGEESSSFINGVLDNILKESVRGG